MERNKERSGDIRVKVIKWTQNEIGREPRIGSHETNEIMRPIHFPLSKKCYSKEQKISIMRRVFSVPTDSGNALTIKPNTGRVRKPKTVAVRLESAQC